MDPRTFIRSLWDRKRTCFWAYTQHTLRYLYRLWHHPLVLETVLKGRYYQLIYDVADQFEIREVQKPAAAMND